MPVAAVLLFLVAAPVGAAASVLTLRAVRAGNTIVASVALRWDSADELVRSLLDGMESRIVFTVRLYQERSGILSLSGDRLLGQAVVIRRAYRDILTEQFIVAEDGAGAVAFDAAADLLAGFLTVPALSFPAPSPGARGIYVVARAELQPVLLMPPLTLVTLVGTAAAFVTPWQRSDVQ
ncbi:MAG TPA: hypothetical protein VL359_00935 [bacterium]|nr:hypothetical protein [bacterium]